MGKPKTFLILLLSLVLLAALAMLPNAVAAVQDSGTLGQTQVSQLQPVQLEIRDDPPAMARLAMMNGLGSVIEVPDQVATMTREEAKEAALTQLQPYMDAGLIDLYDIFHTEIRCMLGQASSNSELNSIFWTVTVIRDDEGLLVIDTAIDDETGSLLWISVTDNYAPYINDPEAILMPFAEIYFTGLGIDDYGYYVTDDLAEQYIGDDAYGIRYRFGDMIYGEVNVDLYVYPYGFYTEFPVVGGNDYETDKYASEPAVRGSLAHSGSLSSQNDGSGAGSAA